MHDIEKFIDWLNEEVEELTLAKPENHMFLWGRYNEAVRIRAMMHQITDGEDESENKSTDIESFERMAAEICDKYCKFPEMYPSGETQKLIDEKCCKCPFERLIQ